MGPRLGAAWFRPELAAAGFGRLAVGAQTKTGAILLPGEMQAVMIALAMEATALRFALPRPSLPVYAIDPSASGEGVADPRTGKGAIMLDPFGAILGRSDPTGARMQLAGCGILHALAKSKETSAPAIGVDFPGGTIPGWTPPPIVGFPGGGEKLGIAPVVVGILAGAVVLCVGVGGWTYTKSREIDADTANKAMAIAAGMQDTRDRWTLEAQTGKTIAPTALEVAAGKVAESVANKETGSRWLWVGIGAAVGVGGVAASNYGARRLGIAGGR